MNIFQKSDAFANRCNRIFLSLTAMLLEFFAGCVVIAVGGEVMGVVLFALFICFLLVVCSNVLATTLPFLLVSVFVCSQYDSFSTFVAYWWLAIPAVAALLFHYIRFCKPYAVGVSFWGMAAVSVAVTLGGVGSITAEEYFRPVALYYLIGLGFGMLAAYLLMKSQFDAFAGREQTEKFLTILYLIGFFCGVFIAKQYLVQWETVVVEHAWVNFQASNNISTFLMFALPIPFYRALSNRFHLLGGLFFYALLMMAASRGGVLMGTLELFLCLFCFCLQSNRKFRLPAIAFSMITAVGSVAILWLFIQTNDMRDPTRIPLLHRAAQAFSRYPFFGQGLASQANIDLYNPKLGAFFWYHMSIPQIIGSMGCVGIFSYLTQFLGRISLIFSRINRRKMVFGLSYAGIALMSLVNPGEFCPIPYELLTVLLFIFLEEEQKEAQRDEI